jgi:Fic family protein
MNADRHSKAEAPDLITDPKERAEREARNALRQFDAAIHVIDDWLQQPEKQFRLRPSLLQQLHRIALDGISIFAGNYRPAGVEIEGSEHRPVGAHLVPEALEELCDYVNENWADKTAVHLAAYVLWRLNWVHPFDDGNGRTARMASYVVLCVRLGCHLPGRYTIPEQIAENKTPYYQALEAADAAFKRGQIDVAALEEYLAGMLAKQLLGVFQSATQKQDTAGLGEMRLH